MERMSRGIDWRAGETRGGRGTQRQRSGALLGAPERDFGRHLRLSRIRARPLMSGGYRRCGQKSWGALDALESRGERRGLREREESTVQRRKMGFHPPSSLLPRAEKHPGARGGLGGVVVKSGAHGD